MEKHATEIEYKGGLEKLAEDLGNLRYDTLAEFFGLLEKKLESDSKKDKDRGRELLSLELTRAALCMKLTKETIQTAWMICMPHMEGVPRDHSSLNDVCEKCGRVYCDHENKY